MLFGYRRPCNLKPDKRTPEQMDKDLWTFLLIFYGTPSLILGIAVLLHKFGYI